jgi:hypothetical protein
VRNDRAESTFENMLFEKTKPISDRENGRKVNYNKGISRKNMIWQHMKTKPNKANMPVWVQSGFPLSRE